MKVWHCGERVARGLSSQVAAGCKTEKQVACMRCALKHLVIVNRLSVDVWERLAVLPLATKHRVAACRVMG